MIKGALPSRQLKLILAWCVLHQDELMQNWELSKGGKIVNYDMSQMIEKGAFCCLKEIEIFLDRCTVMNDTLAWDISGNWDDTSCLDIDPDTLYALPHVEEAIA